MCPLMMLFLLGSFIFQPFFSNGLRFNFFNMNMNLNQPTNMYDKTLFTVKDNWVNLKISSLRQHLSKNTEITYISKELKEEKE